MPSTVLVTGANGYIGNAVARSFVRAGWETYGLIRSEKNVPSLEKENIAPIVGSIDDRSSHGDIIAKLPKTLNAIVSTTEYIMDYVPHYKNTISLLRTVAEATIQAGGDKPLVIFSSGCKDYGMGTRFDGDPDLAPHTEDSPPNPPAVLAPRTKLSIEILDHADVCHPVLVRPTNVYGWSSSFYSNFFDVAERAATAKQPLKVHVEPKSILHALHVDDCADAYVAIAAHPKREEVAGEVFNISHRQYETVGQVLEALAKEYGIDKVEYLRPEDFAEGENPWMPYLLEFNQWVDSGKLRRVTGWQDRLPLFSDDMGLYRRQVEESRKQEGGGFGGRMTELSKLVQETNKA